MGAPKRVAVGLLAGALSVFGVAFAPSASAAADVDTARLAGATRYGTSAAVSGNAAFDGATTAIVATGENFPDALAASALAGDDAPAPIVLTESDSLSDEAVAALDELGVTNVTVVGGTAAVSAGVVTALEGEGYTVTRVAGTTRYGTAAAIAGAVGTAADLNGLATAVIATGVNFPDALAGGPLSYEGHPLLLVNSSGVPAETEAALTALGAEQVVILGGTAVVSAATETALEDIVGNDAIRVAGTNRNGTAAAVGETLVASFGYAPTDVLLASGVNFPDALVAGPLGGELEAPIILAGSLPTESQAFLDDHSDTITDITAIGGTAVIDDETLDAAEAAAETVSNDTPATPAGVTSQPELVSASVGATTTTGINVGTVVRFVFDEPVSTTVGVHTAGGFWAITGTGGRNPGTSVALVTGNPNALDVRFAGITSAAVAGTLSMATVDEGAALDTTGERSPEGDAGLNSGTSPTLTAGQTTAPDLTAVGNFRQATTTLTFVDFTFDEAATNVAPGGYRLIGLSNGETVCTFDSGNSMVTHTVICPSAGGGAGPALSAANFARGTVDANTVRNASGVMNPLQSADISNSGNTGTAPDIVSGTIDHSTTAQDYLFVTFDQSVATPVFGSFQAYRANGTEVVPTGATTSPATPNQVRLTFTNGDLQSVVGVSADDGAIAAAGGTAPGTANQQDEVGVTNTATTTTTGGRTDDPDLDSVTRVAATDVFGTPTGGFNVTYAFDEDIATATPANFYLYLADGTRLRGTTCVALTIAGGGTEDTDHTVRCTAFIVVATGAAAANAQVQSAVLGTVDNAAVTAETGAVANHEGASAVS